MEIKHLEVKEFERKYNDELLKHEALNQLILGNIIYTKNSIEKGIEIDSNNTFGIISKDNKVLYFFCNYMPYGMVITPNGEIDKEDEIDSAKLLVKDLLDNSININGIQSTESFCEVFINEYPKEFKLENAMDIMLLTKVKEKELNGSMYLANEDNIDELIEMWICFEKEALNKEVSYKESKETWLNRLSDKNSLTWLYEVEGKIVGMNGSTRKLEHGRSISYVYIKPEERNKGYAKEMVSCACKYYLEYEKCDYVTLYVDKKNPISNSAYLSVGFDYLLDVYSYNINNSVN